MRAYSKTSDLVRTLSRQSDARDAALASLLAVAFGIAAVLVGVLVRAGWVSEERRVSDVACEDRARRRRRSTTTRSRTYECRVVLEGLEGEGDLEVVATYDRESAVPEAGDTVRVYFDPSDVAGTATLAGPGGKIALVVGLALASVVAAIVAGDSLRAYARAR